MCTLNLLQKSIANKEEHCIAKGMTSLCVNSQKPTLRVNINGSNNSGDHLFSTYVKFSEKLIFLTNWYAHVHEWTP